MKKQAWHSCLVAKVLTLHARIPHGCQFLLLLLHFQLPNHGLEKQCRMPQSLVTQSLHGKHSRSSWLHIDSALAAVTI